MPGRETEVQGSRILLRSGDLTVPADSTATFRSMAVCRLRPAGWSGAGVHLRPRIQIEDTGGIRIVLASAACTAGGEASVTATGKTLSAAEPGVLSPGGW